MRLPGFNPNSVMILSVSVAIVGIKFWCLREGHCREVCCIVAIHSVQLLLASIFIITKYHTKKFTFDVVGDRVPKT